MKCKLLTSFLFAVAVMALGSTAVATTWYVNGVSGSNNNNCLSPTTACKTIEYAISLAASGDLIKVAAATYTENLTIAFSLTIAGSGAPRPIIDGGATNTVVTISSASAQVVLANVTIRNGNPGGIDNIGTLTVNYSAVTGNTGNKSCFGGGIANSGTLAINNSTISGNRVQQLGLCRGFGGGIANSGTLTIYHSHISGNVGQTANVVVGTAGGGIYNRGMLTINNGTISGNMASGPSQGGGIFNGGTLTINNSTISGNTGIGGTNGYHSQGGGIYNSVSATLKINNSTVSGNKVLYQGQGGGIFNGGTLIINNATISANGGANGSLFGGNLYGTARMQNSIIANSLSGGNCHGTVASKGYNLSSDGTCNLTNTGDLNNTDPMLGPLQSNGGPTQTMALPSGSPAIDAGNPNGCTDSGGHLLTTDQRGQPRPDKEDSVGCDMGAYESQNVASGPFLTGYCVTWGGYPPGCHKAVDLTHCPPGRPAAGVSSNSCGKYSAWSICQVPGFEGGKCLVQ